jgi:hypothetical protein
MSPRPLFINRVRPSIGHMSNVALYYSLRNSEFGNIKNAPMGIFV